MAVGPTGPLYLARSQSGSIWAADVVTGTASAVVAPGFRVRYGEPGMAVEALPGRLHLGDPAGLALDDAGHLDVADSKAILRIDLATGGVTTIAGRGHEHGRTLEGDTAGIGQDARFSYPSGLAADGSGDLFIADTGDGTIRRLVVATGKLTTFAGTPWSFGHRDGVGAAAGFERPTALAFDGIGALYVADRETVRRIDLATRTVTTVVGIPGQRGVAPGPLPAGLNEVGGLACGPGGTLYVTDSAENVVLEVR